MCVCACACLSCLCEAQCEASCKGCRGAVLSAVSAAGCHDGCRVWLCSLSSFCRCVDAAADCLGGAARRFRRRRRRPDALREAQRGHDDACRPCGAGYARDDAHSPAHAPGDRAQFTTAAPSLCLPSPPEGLPWRGRRSSGGGRRGGASACATQRCRRWHVRPRSHCGRPGAQRLICRLVRLVRGLHSERLDGEQAAAAARDVAAPRGQTGDARAHRHRLL